MTGTHEQDGPGEVLVRLRKPGKGTTISYRAEVLARERSHLLVRARWQQPALDLGYVTFEPGDRFYEHYYSDRWFNIFEVRSEDGRRKGWYCNVARPAVITQGTVTSEDLELDLFVSADGRELLTLDADEFERRFPKPSATRSAALHALEVLQEMAKSGVPPFETSSQP